MGKNPIAKITRRLFNKTLLIFSSIIPFGFKSKQDYMEVIIIPEKFRYPYSPEVKEIFYNHIKSSKGKSRNQIKKDIIEKHSKKIRIPIK